MKYEDEAMAIFVIIIIILTFFIPVRAHDIVVKDKYGRVTGYADVQKDKVVVKDKYGRVTGTIEEKD